jgi:glycosyltransferase involved in cell wall biosynthesis
MREKFNEDSRIRLYRKSENSGNIGNVKNEAVSLSRGKYVLELDHDDEIVADLFENATNVFEEDSEVGFVYADFINVYENGNNFHYGDFLCKGYAGYYCQKYKGRWSNVYMTPNINNITLSHLVCCPNHPRIWKRDTLNQLGNYSEFLPICDDYEILLRTACNTKMAKIHKLGYIQYMNENNNNFSLIRNGEINRIGPQFIFPQFYQKYDVHNVMKEKDAYEDENYIHNHSKIWERDETTYEHKICNKIINPDYDFQVCVIGFQTLLLQMDKIKSFQSDERNDIIVLDNTMNMHELCAKIDKLGVGFDKVKCYAMRETSRQELARYFHLLYRSCENVLIVD